MRMPTHAALCSFTFSLLLTSALVPSGGNVELASAGAPAAQLAVQAALNGLRAEGFAGGTKLALPAPSASPASASAASATAPQATLTPELMSKLLHYNALIGKDMEIRANFANALGLTATGQNWACRQAVAINEGIKHGFAVSRGNDQDLFLFVHYPDVAHAFRVQRNGTLLTAFDVNTKTIQITQRAPLEAQADLDAEIAFWNSYIDLLIAGR